MLRTGASRHALLSLATPGARSAGATFSRAASPVQWTAKITSLSSKRPRMLSLARLKTTQAAVFRRTLADKIDTKAEEKYAHEKLKPTPETVSATSSIRPIFSEIGTKNPENEVDMMAGVKHDLNMVKKPSTCLRCHGKHTTLASRASSHILALLCPPYSVHGKSPIQPMDLAS